LFDEVGKAFEIITESIRGEKAKLRERRTMLYRTP